MTRRWLWIALAVAGGLGVPALVLLRGQGTSRPTIDEWKPGWQEFRGATEGVSQRLATFRAEFESKGESLSKSSPEVLELYSYCGEVTEHLTSSQRRLLPAPTAIIERAVVRYFQAAIPPFWLCVGDGDASVAEGNPQADNRLLEVDALLADKRKERTHEH